ncbi:MAG: PQQ-binding-like beta-propeller repeat protein [Elusimicrobiota bacterium]
MNETIAFLRRTAVRAAALALVAPAAASAADWPLFRGNAGRTGYAAEQAAPPLAKAWEFQAAGGIVSSPAVYDGTVYIGSRANRFYALDARTGALLWSRLTAGWVDSSPYVSSTTVYAACLGGRLYAMDRLTGALRWITDLGAASASSPLVLDGRVYVGTGSPENKLKVYDAGTGGLLAAFQAAQPVDSAPSTDGSYVYFGANNGQVYALDALTLASRWSAYPTDGSFGLNAVALSSGTLYFLPGRDDKRAAAFDAAGGVLLSSSPALTKTGPWTQTGSPAVDAGGFVYFTAGAADTPGEEAHLAALSSGTLSAVWASSVSLGGVSPIGVLASPALVNEIIYAATPGGRLIAVSSSGVLLTAPGLDISSPAYSSPAVSDGMVIAANYGGKVFGFSAGRHASISSPRAGEILGGTVAVRGWFDSPDLAGYELEYSTGGEVPQWVRVSSAAAGSAAENAELAAWDVTGLANGEYLLRLRVLETPASGYDASAVVRLRVNAPPLPPSGLTAADVPGDGGNHIALSWTASPSAGVSSYRIYRDDGSGPGLSPLASTAAVSYVDGTALTGSTFAYAVSAWDGWAESARTEEVYAFSVNDSGDDTPPSAVTDLAAAAGQAGGGVFLVWTAPGDDGDVGEASHYLIRYSTDPAQDWSAFGGLSGSSRPVDGPAGITESDEYGGLFAGVTYYFALKAVDDAGNAAALSNIASAWAAFDPYPPLPPSALTVSDAPGDEGGSLDLVWTLSPDDGAGAGDVYGYHVFRRTLNSAYVSSSPYASVGAGASSYRDPAATTNVRYYYSVTAFDSTNDSALSGEASGVSADNWRFLSAVGGGVVRLPDGMEVTVPAAAASQNDKIMVTRLDPSTYEPLFNVRAAAANPTDIVYQVRFQNPATTLSAPAVISLPYTDADVEGMDLENLRVYTLDGGKWAMLNTSSVDAAAKKISAEVAHFSIFRVMEYVPAGEVISAAEVYTYPNPARGDTVTFKFRPVYKAHVTIEVYNVAGEKVARFERADAPAGIASEIVWRAGGIASGVYVYRVRVETSAGSRTLTRKLAILR